MSFWHRCLSSLSRTKKKKQKMSMDSQFLPLSRRSHWVMFNSRVAFWGVTNFAVWFPHPHRPPGGGSHSDTLRRKTREGLSIHVQASVGSHEIGFLRGQAPCCCQESQVCQHSRGAENACLHGVLTGQDMPRLRVSVPPFSCPLPTGRALW